MGESDSAEKMRVYAKALCRAAEILGGREKLRTLLKVSPRRVDAWMAGVEEPPIDVFLKAVDVISAAPPPQFAPAGGAVARSHETRRASEMLRVATAPMRQRSAEVQAAALAGGRAARAAKPGPEGLRIVAQRGFDAPFLEFFGLVTEGDGCACGRALKLGERIVVRDVEKDLLFAGTPAGEVMVKAHARAVQSTPLVSASGQLLGVLSTHYERPREVGEHELDIIEHVARRAAFWLDGGAL